MTPPYEEWKSRVVFIQVFAPLDPFGPFSDSTGFQFGHPLTKHGLPVRTAPQLLFTAVDHRCATLVDQWTITQPVQGSPVSLFHAGPVFSPGQCSRPYKSRSCALRQKFSCEVNERYLKTSLAAILYKGLS